MQKQDSFVAGEAVLHPFGVFSSINSEQIQVDVQASVADDWKLKGKAVGTRVGIGWGGGRNGINGINGIALPMESMESMESTESMELMEVMEY